ncbi:MAG: hypothetical protein ABFR32_03815 [Bacteroidota bacterium]
MKKLVKIFFLITVLVTSCRGDINERNPNFLAPLSIEIPDNVKNDSELVGIIESSEKAINEFSDNIEQLAIDGKELLNKKEENYSLADGLKSGKLMLQFVSNSTQMATAFEEFNTYVDSKKTQGIINVEQLKALEEIGKSFGNRIDQINIKYKGLFNY